MDKNSILEFNNKESVSDVLNELLRSGAQKLIHNAVEAELREFMSQHQGVTEDGKVSVIRNGYLPKREILTGIAPVSVRIPKVRSKDGEALTFRFALVPPYVRKTRSLEAALPMSTFLRGIPSGFEVSKVNFNSYRITSRLYFKTFSLCFSSHCPSTVCWNTFCLQTIDNQCYNVFVVKCFLNYGAKGGDQTVVYPQDPFLYF